MFWLGQKALVLPVVPFAEGKGCGMVTPNFSSILARSM